MCVCAAVTHQASWEAAAKLMDAKERQREEGEEEGRLSQVGDKCLLLQQCRSEGGMSMNWKKKEKESVDREQCRTEITFAWLTGFAT